MVKKLLFIPALAIGVLALVYMMRNKKEPPVRPIQEQAKSIRSLVVPRTSFVPRVVGYGEARPGRVWRAVPQVAGRIVHLAPNVREGSFISAGTPLVEIERSDYDLEVLVSKSKIAALEAQLREAKTTEETLGTMLTIEKKSLTLARAELTRIGNLAGKGTVSKATLDAEKRSTLAQTGRVQDIENRLTLLSPKRDVLNAQIAQETSRLARAELAVKRTTIKAPFDCRIGQVHVEQDQVVQVGKEMFLADATDTTEVTAWLALPDMRRLMSAGTSKIDTLTLGDELRKKLGFEATLRASGKMHTNSWKGEVVRIRGIDNRTRSLGLDVAVKEPYKNVVPGKSPPLAPGLYVEVEIKARPRPDQVVIPRSAIHGNFMNGGVVYLVGEGNRLESRPVEVAMVQSDLAVIRKGLEGGEQLILTDLAPAIRGMLLAPIDDADTLDAILKRARAEPSSK